MTDNLEEFRQQADESFFDEFDEDENAQDAQEKSSRLRLPAITLTPQQRFILAILLLLATCLLSTLCLLAAGKIAPPVLF